MSSSDEGLATPDRRVGHHLAGHGEVTRRMVALPSGLRLHVASAGQGPVVLLIHGFPQTWRCWRHVIDLLAADHLVIAPDYRGAGLSDRPLDGYDKATMASDLVEVVERVAGTPVEHVIGHDIGAMVAASLAMQQPDLRSLTLVDTPIPGTDTWDRIAANPRVWHVAFHANVDLAERLVTGNEHVYIDEFIRVRIGNPAAVTDESLRHYVEAYRRPGALRAAFSAYAAIPLDAQRHRAALSTPLVLPTLTVGGTLSTGGPLMTAAGDEVSTNHRNVTIDGAGHWIPEEAPGELVEAWRTWQQDLRSMGR